MDVLFVHSISDIKTAQRPLRTAEEMQFGISYICSLLKKHGHSVKLVVLSKMLGKRNGRIIDLTIKRFSPEVICFTAVSSEYRFIAALAKYIKSSYPQLYLLAGGPHVSLNPQQAVGDSFDAICIGEGEFPALELVSQMEAGASPAAIANLWIKHGAEIEKTPPRPFLKDLNSLPFPDRDIWNEWLEEEPGSAQPILLGRGCPFECTYCCNHALKKIASGPYVRLRSAENILQELEELTAQYPSKRNIYLEVETIGIDKTWTLNLCTRLQMLNAALNQPLSFGVNLRLAPNIDYAGLFAAFQKSNFKFINIGLESGSERLRRQILNRNYSNRDIINTVGLARRYGLRVNFFNLIGIPGETREDFKETVEINRSCLPEKTLTHIFYPYPGTRLYSLCQEQGLFKKTTEAKVEPAPELILERCKATLDLPGFSKKQIQKAFILFDYYVYRGHRSLGRILVKVAIAKLRSNIYLFYLYRRLSYLPFFKRLKYVLKQRIFRRTP